MVNRNKEIDALFKAILSLKDLEQCENFFDDLCTIKELQSMAQRLQVAKLLREKKTFTEIAAVTGASSATISRVNKCIMYGANGYEYVLNHIKK